MTSSLYQTQLHYVFNRPITEPRWYWQTCEEESPFGEEEDALTAFLFYEQLCQQPGLDLAAYSDEQVGQGLIYLFDGAVSNLVHGFKAADVPIARKVAALRALSVLFREVFAPRCPAVLSSHSRESLGPLSYICYMFWDVTPLSTFLKYKDKDALLLSALNTMSESLEEYMSKEMLESLKMHFENIGVEALSGEELMARHQDLLRNKDEDTGACYQAIASVMESCLYLDNPACIESGLHGLGHMATFQSDIAIPIIDRYLKNAKKQDKRLLDYAKGARTGMIL